MREARAKDWPTGFRSEPMNWREAGLWRPLAAVLGAVLIPGLIAAGLLLVAGTPGVTDGGGWLREQILFVVITLAAAPFVAWFFLPLLWPLALLAVVKGWAGALSAMALACAVGLPALHVILLGDVTTEDPSVVPNLVLALGCQGLTGWMVFWGLMRLRRAATRTG